MLSPSRSEGAGDRRSTFEKMKAGLSGGLEKERFAIGCDEMTLADHFSDPARPPM
jgi:hypothetical protein